MNILFNLVLILNGQTYIIDHDMTAADCLAAITAEYDAGRDISHMRCEVQP